MKNTENPRSELTVGEVVQAFGVPRTFVYFALQCANVTGVLGRLIDAPNGRTKLRLVDQETFARFYSKAIGGEQPNQISTHN